MYQAGTAQLEDDGYDMDTQKFKLKITPQAWAKKLDLSSKGFIVIPKDQARALWQEGMKKPVFVTIDLPTGPLEGTWRGIIDEKDSQLRVFQFRFVKDKVFFKKPNEIKEEEMSFVIDESKEPKQLDLIFKYDNKNVKGPFIYERMGNTLKICGPGSKSSNERPSEFKTTDSQFTVTLYLQETVPTPELGQAFLVGTQQQWPIQQLSLINERYLDNGDGTITDVQTNLMWKRCNQGQEWNGTTCIGEANAITWKDAMLYSAQGTWSAFAGYSNWRVPNKDELLSLVYCSNGEPTLWNNTGNACKGEYQQPTIEQMAFPGTPKNWFWTSSPHDKMLAWMVDFEGGSATYSFFTSYGHAIRLVREEK